VHFNEPGGTTFVVQDDTLVTEHEILVYGLRRDTTYELKAFSEDGDGALAWLSRVDMQTDILPNVAGLTELVTHDPESIQEGWTLTSVILSGPAEETERPLLVMLDEEGQPVWYRDLTGIGTKNGLEASLIDDGQHILVGGTLSADSRPLAFDWAGDKVWEGPAQVMPDQTGFMHHTFQKLPNGNYLTLAFHAVGGDDSDMLLEMDASFQPIFQWDTAALYPDTYSAGWCNMARVDLEEDVAYLSVRSEDAVLKIDRGSGDLLWSLGEGLDFQMVGAHEDPWFAGQHAPTFLPNGHMLVYDNGQGARYYTRVMEYALDEEQMEAEVVWEYPGDGVDDIWYADAYGDADRLANGNTLITVGNLFSGITQARILEVTPDKEVASEVHFHPTMDATEVTIYMAERIPCPLEVL